MSGRRKERFDNEAVVKYIWDGIHDGDGYMRAAYPDLADIFDYEELRNRVIDQAKKDPGYLEKAFFDINDGISEDDEDYVPPTVFVPSAMKERDLDFGNMPLADVNAYSNRIAQALGYADNGDELGAYKAAAKALSGNDRKMLAEAVRSKLEPATRREFLMAIGLNPDLADIDDRVVDRVFDYFDRSGRAADFDENTSGAGKYIQSVLAPYTYEARREGRKPTVSDGAVDAALLFAGGPLLKVAGKAVGPLVGYGRRGLSALVKAADKFGKNRPGAEVVGKSVLKTPGSAAAYGVVNEYADAAHEIGNDLATTRTYETGDNRRTGKDEPGSDLWRLAPWKALPKGVGEGFASGLAPAAGVAVLKGTGAKLEPGLRRFVLGGKTEKNAKAAAKRQKTVNENKAEKLKNQQDLNDAEHEQFLKGKRSEDEFISRTAAKKAEDRRIARVLEELRRKNLELDEVIAGNVPVGERNHPYRKAVLDWVERRVENGLNQLGFKTARFNRNDGDK